MDDPRFSHLAYYERLVLTIKQQVLAGVLAAGDKLPSVRDMAKQMQLNPNTVAKAYKALEAQHVVYVKPGLGSFVAEAQPQASESVVAGLETRFKSTVVSALAAGVTVQDLQAWLAECAEGGVI